MVFSFQFLRVLQISGDRVLEDSNSSRYLEFAGRTGAAGQLVDLALVEAGAQRFDGGHTVLQLRPVRLALDDQSGRYVSQTHGTFGRVDVLAAGAAGSLRIHP